jgi:hypothetical protein
MNRLDSVRVWPWRAQKALDSRIREHASRLASAPVSGWPGRTRDDLAVLVVVADIFRDVETMEDLESAVTRAAGFAARQTDLLHECWARGLICAVLVASINEPMGFDVRGQLVEGIVRDAVDRARREQRESGA